MYCQPSNFPILNMLMMGREVFRIILIFSNFENGGSLTIIATALTETGSKMDGRICTEKQHGSSFFISVTSTIALPSPIGCPATNNVDNIG